MGMRVEGSFHVCNSYDDVMRDVRRDNVPRYGVCDTIGLRGMRTRNESARDGAGPV